MRVGGLFEGIGGMSLGLQWAGYEIAWHVEKEASRRAVLEANFPGVPCFEDVRHVGAAELEWVDVVAAGFPCPGFSLAGRGAAFDHGESGLWSEVVRIVRELRPRYLLVENVAALLARGMGRVLGDLAACGYDAEWDCVPAAAAGAPHLRDRIWLVAYADDAGRGEQRWPQPAPAQRSRAERVDPVPPDAAREGEPRDERSGLRPGGQSRKRRRRPRDLPRADAARAPAPAAEDRTWAALPGWRPALAGWHSGHAPDRSAPEPFLSGVDARISGRVDRCDALGDTLVPQIAEVLGRRILSWERDAAA